MVLRVHRQVSTSLLVSLEVSVTLSRSDRRLEHGCISLRQLNSPLSRAFKSLLRHNYTPYFCCIIVRIFKIILHELLLQLVKGVLAFISLLSALNLVALGEV
jgi:hypothetical protein